MRVNWSTYLIINNIYRVNIHAILTWWLHIAMITYANSLNICQPKFERGCCEMLVFRVCGERQNFHVFSLYLNPGLDDRILDCLLTSMAAVQAEDMLALFLFVCDLNNHHREWYCLKPQIVIVLQPLTATKAVGRSDPCTWWNTCPTDD